MKCGTEKTESDLGTRFVCNTVQDNEDCAVPEGLQKRQKLPFELLGYGMCGIGCSWASNLDLSTDLLRKRGPDHFQVSAIGESPKVFFFSAVLHMRGDEICKQPLRIKNWTFLWNGEVYGGSLKIPKGVSDTSAVFNFLIEDFSPQQLVCKLEMLSGEFSFLLYNCDDHTLYFGRDPVGRRSLLRGNGHICSVAMYDLLYSEVSCQGIHSINVSTGEADLFPWNQSTALKISTALDFPFDSENVLEISLKLLTEAVRRRCENRAGDSVGGISILFSGGLDSSILARIADMILPAGDEIELVNVAFENENFLKSSNFEQLLVPDRKTGLITLESLRSCSPLRNWKFVPIDVRLEQLKTDRALVRRLMAPCDTVLDESIATALWYASSGCMYKAVLVGSGADEQFAGYSRHRVAFQRGGIDALLAEVQLDISRISDRNLGRDDRCISDHAHESSIS